MKKCPRCGTQNLDEDVDCGVCGARLDLAILKPSSKWKSVLLHYMTAPIVGVVGVLWLWFVDGLTGLLFLLFAAGLLMASIGPGPSEEVASSWRYRWYWRGYKIGKTLATNKSDSGTKADQSETLSQDRPEAKTDDESTS